MSEIHPILQPLTLSQEQQEAALGCGDILVTAGAGTGKTRTLTARFLSLLAQGEPLRGIVAITFTRKAAREMRNRIREEIWNYLERSDLSRRERDYWSRIASELDAARISTIHGLCQEILRSHPVEARIDPDFQVLEEGRMVLWQHEALEEAMTWAAGQAHLAPLFSEVEEQWVRKALANLLKQGRNAKTLLAQLPDDPDLLLEQWQAQLRRFQREILAELTSIPAWREAVASIREAPLAQVRRGDKLVEKLQVALQALTLLERPDDEQAFRQGVALLRSVTGRNVGSAGNWPGGKAQVTALNQAVNFLKNCFHPRKSADSRKHFALLGESLNAEDARSAWRLLLLKKIALQAFAIYEGMKQEKHVLDFDDLEVLAVRLLEDHPDALARWQGEVAALLVDEYQDTNPRQAQLLHLLDGGRSRLFLVGDAKQSIYRFRGADVAVFTQEEKQFRQQRKRLVHLRATYRAHPQLISSLNALFEPILKDARHPWEARFDSLTPARTQPPAVEASAYVEILLAPGNKDHALPAAARAAVDRLLELFEMGYEPKDVAILCRASSSFAAYEDALDKANIPFLTLAGRGFFQRPEVRDLVVVMRAAADPTDDVALIGALRSPGIGLSDVALTALAQSRDERQRQARAAGDRGAVPLWEVVLHPPEDFPEEEQARLAYARQLLTKLHGLAGRVSVADVLKRYLDETNYLAILAAAGQHRAVRNVDKLLADVRKARFVQIDAFLSWFQLTRDVDVREGEAPVVAEGAGQIMTVHRAKGLEFPIVILGDVTWAQRRSPDLITVDDFIVWKLPGAGKEKEKPLMHDMLHWHVSRQEEAENKRLLYVAATRAKDFLIINGYVSRGASGWLKLLQMALPNLEALWKEEHSAPYECELHHGEQRVRCVRVPLEAPARAFASSDAGLQPDFELQPALLQGIAMEEEWQDEDTRQREAEPERRVWRILPPAEEKRVWAPSWIVGKLVHRAIELQRFPDHPTFIPWLEASARSLGISDERMLQNARQRVQRLLTQFRQSPIWQEIQRADQRLFEVPFSYQDPVQQRVHRGAIDLICRHGDAWTLIDFKTDRVRTREEMLAVIRDKGYDRQVRSYARAMKSILGVEPVAQLCFLDVAGKVEVSLVMDDRLEEA